jgi:hypothetical protein
LRPLIVTSFPPTKKLPCWAIDRGCWARVVLVKLNANTMMLAKTTIRDATRRIAQLSRSDAAEAGMADECRCAALCL